MYVVIDYIAVKGEYTILILILAIIAISRLSILSKYINKCAYKIIKR